MSIHGRMRCVRTVWHWSVIGCCGSICRTRPTFSRCRPRLLHIAPEYCFIKRFERLPRLDYVTADLESPLAKVKMDIQQIPFPDNEFDIIFCNHILEHVEDDRLAMREMFRVMRPGGWGRYALAGQYGAGGNLRRPLDNRIPMSGNVASGRRTTCATTDVITGSSWPRPVLR